MSTTTPSPSDAPLIWRQADHDVYVATRAGEFAGFVAVDGDAHVLHDGLSRRIGSYGSLSAARSALSGHGAPGRPAVAPPNAPRTDRAQRRRPRRRRPRTTV